MLSCGRNNVEPRHHHQRRTSSSSSTSRNVVLGDTRSSSPPAARALLRASVLPRPPPQQRRWRHQHHGTTIVVLVQLLLLFLLQVCCCCCGGDGGVQVETGAYRSVGNGNVVAAANAAGADVNSEAAAAQLPAASSGATGANFELLDEFQRNDVLSAGQRQSYYYYYYDDDDGDDDDESYAYQNNNNNTNNHHQLRRQPPHKLQPQLRLEQWQQSQDYASEQDGDGDDDDDRDRDADGGEGGGASRRGRRGFGAGGSSRSRSRSRRTPHLRWRGDDYDDLVVAGDGDGEGDANGRSEIWFGERWLYTLSARRLVRMPRCLIASPTAESGIHSPPHFHCSVKNSTHVELVFMPLSLGNLTARLVLPMDEQDENDDDDDEEWDIYDGHNQDGQDVRGNNDEHNKDKAATGTGAGADASDNRNRRRKRRKIRELMLRGIGLTNPFRPFGLNFQRLPAGLPYEPWLYLHNPLSTPIRLDEVFVTNSVTFAVDVPEGTSWTIPAHRTRPVARILFAPNVATVVAGAGPASNYDHNSNLLYQISYVRVRSRNGEVSLFLPLRPLPTFVLDAQLSSAAAAASSSQSSSSSSSSPSSSSSSSPSSSSVSSVASQVAKGLYFPAKSFDIGPVLASGTPQVVPLNVVNTSPKAVSLQATADTDGLQLSTSEKSVASGKTCTVLVTVDPQRVSRSSGHLQLRSGSKWRLQVPYSLQWLNGSLQASNTRFYIGAKGQRVFSVEVTNTFSNGLRIERILVDSAPVSNPRPPSEVPPSGTVQIKLPTVVPVRENATASSQSASRPQQMANPPEQQQPPPPQQERQRPMMAASTRPHCFNSSLRVLTNITEFEYNLEFYSNRLDLLLDRRPVAELLDRSVDLPERVLYAGTLGILQKKKILLGLYNPNPVDVLVEHVASNLSMSYFSLPSPPPWTLGPRRELQLSLTLSGPDEGLTSGLLTVKTEFHSQSWPFVFQISKGTVTAAAGLSGTAAGASASGASSASRGGGVVSIDGAFPFRHSSELVYLESSFEMPLVVASARVEDDDPRFSIDLVKSPVLHPGAKSLLGTLRYQPSCASPTSCYVGLGGPLETTSAKDLYLWRGMQERLKETRPLNVSLVVDTQHVKGFVIPVTVSHVWPRVTPRGSVRFETTRLGEASETPVIVDNPSDEPLMVQAYVSTTGGPEVHSILAAQHAIKLGHLSSAFSLPRSVQNSLSIIPPRSKKKIVVRFEPASIGAHLGVLVVRNNLTAVGSVLLRGDGGVGKLLLAGQEPSGIIVFDLNAAQLKDCGNLGVYTTLKKYPVAKNVGQLPIRVKRVLINQRECVGFGFRVKECADFVIKPNASQRIELSFTPDFTVSRVEIMLSLVLDDSTLDFNVVFTLPKSLLSSCAELVMRPPWEGALYAVCLIVSLLFVLCIVCYAFLDSNRVLEETLFGYRHHRKDDLLNSNYTASAAGNNLNNSGGGRRRPTDSNGYTAMVHYGRRVVEWLTTKPPPGDDGDRGADQRNSVATQTGMDVEHSSGGPSISAGAGATSGQYDRKGSLQKEHSALVGSRSGGGGSGRRRDSASNRKENNRRNRKNHLIDSYVERELARSNSADAIVNEEPEPEPEPEPGPEPDTETAIPTADDDAEHAPIHELEDELIGKTSEERLDGKTELDDGRDRSNTPAEVETETTSEDSSEASAESAAVAESQIIEEVVVDDDDDKPECAKEQKLTRRERKEKRRKRDALESPVTTVLASARVVHNNNNNSNNNINNIHNNTNSTNNNNISSSNNNNNSSSNNNSGNSTTNTDTKEYRENKENAPVKEPNLSHPKPNPNGLSATLPDVCVSAASAQRKPPAHTPSPPAEPQSTTPAVVGLSPSAVVAGRDRRRDARCAPEMHTATSAAAAARRDEREVPPRFKKQQIVTLLRAGLPMLGSQDATRQQFATATAVTPATPARAASYSAVVSGGPSSSSPPLAAPRPQLAQIPSQPSQPQLAQPMPQPLPSRFIGSPSAASGGPQQPHGSSPSSSSSHSIIGSPHGSPHTMSGSPHAMISGSPHSSPHTISGSPHDSPHAVASAMNTAAATNTSTDSALHSAAGMRRMSGGNPPPGFPLRPTNAPHMTSAAGGGSSGGMVYRSGSSGGVGCVSGGGGGLGVCGGAGSIGGYSLASELSLKSLTSGAGSIGGHHNNNNNTIGSTSGSSNNNNSSSSSSNNNNNNRRGSAGSCGGAAGGLGLSSSSAGSAIVVEPQQQCSSSSSNNNNDEQEMTPLIRSIIDSVIPAERDERLSMSWLGAGTNMLLPTAGVFATTVGDSNSQSCIVNNGHNTGGANGGGSGNGSANSDNQNNNNNHNNANANNSMINNHRNSKTMSPFAAKLNSALAASLGAPNRSTHSSLSAGANSMNDSANSGLHLIGGASGGRNGGRSLWGDNTWRNSGLNATSAGIGMSSSLSSGLQGPPGQSQSGSPPAGSQSLQAGTLSSSTASSGNIGNMSQTGPVTCGGASFGGSATTSMMPPVAAPSQTFPTFLRRATPERDRDLREMGLDLHQRHVTHATSTGPGSPSGQPWSPAAAGGAVTQRHHLQLTRGHPLQQQQQQHQQQQQQHHLMSHPPAVSPTNDYSYTGADIWGSNSPSMSPTRQTVFPSPIGTPWTPFRGPPLTLSAVREESNASKKTQ